MPIRSKDLSPKVRAMIAKAEPAFQTRIAKALGRQPEILPVAEWAADRLAGAREAMPGAPQTPGAMNKGETRYRDHLKMLVLAGEVRMFRFEALRLRLAERTTLLPDFMVVLPDWTVELHEVKGRKGDSFYCREDAWIKLKVAASLYPWWTFKVVWPAPGGGAWREKEIKP